MVESQRHFHATLALHDQHDALASGSVPARSSNHSLALRASPANMTLFIGLGSAHGDDQAGWMAAEELERRLDGPSPGITIRQLSSPLDVIEELDDIERLIVCDACDTPLTVGQLRRWIWPTDELVRTRSSNSHQLGLTEVLSLAATLQRLPPLVEIWGIGGCEFRPGSEPSPLVRAACRRLATQLSEEFARA